LRAPIIVENALSIGGQLDTVSLYGACWWYSLVVLVGGTRWWYSLVVLVGGTRWWYSLVVLVVQLVQLCATSSTDNTMKLHGSL
jgi:hypothetical protein